MKMTEKEEKLHEFAKRSLLSQEWDSLNRSLEVKRITDEARIYNIDPNEIFQYIQNHREIFNNELKEYRAYLALKKEDERA